MNRVSEHQTTTAERAQKIALAGLLASGANAQRFSTALGQAHQRENRKHDDFQPRQAAQTSRQKNDNNQPATPVHRAATESSMQTLNKQAQHIAECLQALSAIQARFGAAAGAVPVPSETARRLARAQAQRELIDRCLRFALLSDEETASASPIRIVLALELFPDTEFTLQRSEHGWRLNARSSSDECCQWLANGADALQSQFTAKGLGEIAVYITRY